MKSKYFREFMVAIFLTFFLQGETLSKPTSDREKNGLVGPVESVHVERMGSSNFSGQWIQEPRSYQDTEIFDERGNLIERITFSPDGGQYPSTKWGFVYDSKGNILERRYYGSDEIIVRKDLYTYTSDAGGKQTEIMSYYYGADGSDGRFIGSEKYFSDSKGNLKEEHYFAEDHSLTTKKVYSYDTRGNRIAEVVHCPGCNGILSKKVMNYDENGRMIETQEFKGDGSLLRKHKLSYDERGNRKSILSYNKEGSLEFKSTLSYEYDDRGNWIKSTEHIDHKDSKKSIITVFRRIVYF
jgi:hypothetical protein